MIKYKVNANIEIEAIDERNNSNRTKFSLPITFSGLNYNFNQFINKSDKLQKAIKTILEEE